MYIPQSVTVCDITALGREEGREGLSPLFGMAVVMEVVGGGE